MPSSWAVLSGYGLLKGAVVNHSLYLALTSAKHSAPPHLPSTLMAMLVARILDPASKLATRRMLCGDTAANSLGRVLGVNEPGRDDRE